MKKLRERIHHLTRPGTGASDVTHVIKSFDPVLHGWGNYFQTRTADREFHAIDEYVRERVLHWMGRRGGQRRRLRAERWPHERASHPAKTVGKPCAGRRHARFEPERCHKGASAPKRKKGLSMSGPPVGSGLVRGLSARLVRTLDIRPGEGRRLLLLVAHGAFSGLPVLLTNIAASALFLSRFDASQLPYIYLADAVVVPLASALFLQMERRMPRHRLLVAIPAAIAGVVIGLRLALGWSTNRWLVALALLSVEILVTLSSIQYWGAVNHVFDVRQGKRLVGIVGAGRTVGLVLCGLAVPGLVRWVGTANLFIAAALCALICLGLLLAIRGAETAVQAAPSPAAASPRAPRQGNPRAYIALVLALVAIYHCNYYCIDNAFYEGLAAHYGGTDRISQVLGPIQSANAFLLLLFNGLAAGRWLTRFGVGGGLLLLPAAGLASAGLAVGAGVLGDGWALVACVLLLRMLEYVFRNSLYVSALNILYQPLPRSGQIRAQALGEGVAGPIASGVAGGVLLALGHAGAGVVAICALVMGLAVAWVPLVWLAQRAYYRLVGLLLIPPVALEPTVDLRSEQARSVLQRGLDSRHSGEALAAWRLLGRAGLAMDPELRAMALAHHSAEVRAEVLRSMEQHADGSPDTLQALATSDPSPDVRGRALRALGARSSEKGLFMLHLDDASPAVREGAMVALLRTEGPECERVCEQRLERLLCSQDPEARASVARMLGDAGLAHHGASAKIARLLVDDDDDVRRAALTAASGMNDPKLWPTVISCLCEPALRATATAALCAAEPTALEALVQVLDDRAAPEALRARSAQVLGCIGGAAVPALLRHLGERRPDLRLAVLGALGRAHYHARAPADAPVLAEIRQEIAIAQCALSAWLVMAGQPALRTALREEVHAAQGRVLALLALLDPRREVLRIESGLQVPALRMFALELLHGLVSPALRAPVLALLEETVPEHQFARLAAWIPPPSRDLATHVAALAADAQGTWHPWTRACALDVLDRVGQVGQSGIPDAVRIAGDASRSEDRLVAENATRTLSRLYPERHALAPPAGGPVSTLIKRVLLLKTVSIFAETSESVLAGIARVVEDVHVETGARVVAKGESGTAMYIVVTGKLRIHDGDRTLHIAGPRELFGEMAALDSAPRSATVSAIEPTHLLRLEQADLYDAMAEHVEIARGVIRMLCERLRTSSPPG